MNLTNITLMLRITSEEKADTIVFPVMFLNNNQLKVPGINPLESSWEVEWNKIKMYIHRGYSTIDAQVEANGLISGEFKNDRYRGRCEGAMVTEPIEWIEHPDFMDMLNSKVSMMSFGDLVAFIKEYEWLNPDLIINAIPDSYWKISLDEAMSYANKDMTEEECIYTGYVYYKNDKLIDAYKIFRKYLGEPEMGVNEIIAARKTLDERVEKQDF